MSKTIEISNSNTKLKNLAAISAACFAVLPILAFIYFKVSSALNWDEWDMVGVVTVRQLGKGLDFATLWSPHNEHRILLLRLLTYVNSMKDLSTVRLMYLSVCLFFISYLVLFKSFLRQHLKQNKLHQIFLLLVPFVFLTWVQKENYFWGVQVIWATSLLGFLLTSLGLTKMNFWLFLTGILLSLISLSTWIALVGLTAVFFMNELFFTPKSYPKSFGRAIAYLLVVFSFFILYAHGLKGELTISTKSFSALKFGIFFVECLGLWTQEMGRSFSVFFGFLFLFFTAWVWQKKIWIKFRFEFYLMILAICISGLITIGRFQDWPLGDHIHGRYVTLILPGIVAALSIFFRTTLNARIQIVCLLFLAANIVITTAKGIAHEYGQQAQLESEQRCIAQHLKDQLAILKSDRFCYEHSYPDPDRLWIIAQDLNSRGLYPFKEYPRESK